MDCFKFNELTEEVFGHLCNVALSKCNDKGERRKAGCGGQAMRKRVLIKNFVSDLFKMHKVVESDARQDGEMMGHDEEEIIFDYEDCEDADTTICEDEEIEEEEIEDMNEEPQTNEHPVSQNNCWLSSIEVHGHERMEPVTYCELGFTEQINARDGAIGRADNVSMMGGGVLSIYDMYSDVSEQATIGELPSASDPLASISSLIDATENTDPTFQTLYEPRYEVSPSDDLCNFSSAPSPLRAMCESAGNVAPLQPMCADPGDEFYLSLNGNSYSEMKPCHLPLQCPSEGLDHETVLTDLDAKTEVHFTGKKRRSNEMYDDSFNMAFQKRIKL